jgi:hypothetical protein|tara:strand:+ start:4019 stop:4603 length:585 start_codon:yes stop_codon:yes gene_type:complete
LYGDSCTWGEAIDEEDRLHVQLENIQAKKVYNFGYPAQSNEHIFKKFVRHVTEHGYPKKVVIGWTSPWRMCVVNEQNADVLSVEAIGHWTSNITPEMGVGKDMISLCPKTLLVRTSDYMMAVREMCKGRTEIFEWHIKPVVRAAGVLNPTALEIGWYKYSWAKGLYHLEFLDRGFDNMHPGPKSIKRLAEVICE